MADWIEPFLRGSSPIPPEVVVEEAIEKGAIANREQLAADCRAALLDSHQSYAPQSFIAFDCRSIPG